MKPKVLLVDDEHLLLEQMRLALAADYDVYTATSENEAMIAYGAEKPPVVIVDLSLNPRARGNLDGIRLLENILSADPSTRIIIVTGNNDNSIAARAMQLGAFDFFAKPVRLNELKVVISRAFYRHRLLHIAPRMDRGPENGSYGIVGASKAIEGIIRSINQLANCDVSVLIYGESGTGKQTIARAIHSKSSRRDNPFVVVKCAGTPEKILERELFGQEEEAPGTLRSKFGKFVLARGGTLYFDELGELTPQLQFKLLKYAQQRNIERYDSSQPTEVTTRIIAGTKRDLEKDLEVQGLLEPFCACLKPVTLKVPPLRERTEDLVPLTERFLKKLCWEHQKPLMTLSPEAHGALLMHPWPGNVRELEHLITSCVIRTSRAVLKPSDLGFTLDEIPTDVNLKAARSAIEICCVNMALSRNHGIISRAARDLGVSRVNLYELIAKYRIRLEEFKALPTVDKPSTSAPEVS